MLVLLVVSIGLGLLGVIVVRFQPDFRFELRLPGQEEEIDDAHYVPVETTFLAGDGKRSEILSSWPNFRGPDRDAISRENVPLRTDWPEKRPNFLWRRPAGQGYAGGAIRNGAVYFLDYDHEKKRDVLLCLSLDDGKEIWQRSYPVAITPSHGVSRTIPTVTEKSCVTIGPKLHVMCVDPMTGELKWFLDSARKYKAKIPEWYAGQCPLVMNDEAGREILMLALGGKDVLMAAIDCETGEEVWKVPNTFRWTPQTHTSPVPMLLDDKQTVVYCGKRGVLGVSAENGEVLWSTTDWKIGIATCPSPLVLPDQRIFFCGGYNTGARMMQIVREGDSYQAKTLFKLKPAIFGSTQQTPIFYENHIFGVRQVDKLMVCLDLDGKVVWDSRGKGKFGDGPYMLADGKFLILDDYGKLTIAEATLREYQKIAEIVVFDSYDAWGPLALAGGHLFLRSFEEVACLDMRKEAENVTK